ncbi:uncharacterized protein LOC127729789 [Mytilus californianus]|uniref:uncharacterized protein LOC127729789 n=1 Tax=Mytilus californianus TaxID=6549 RepID=UPI00224781D7|nr:uncharacterized protein LOC127729789 [Mytilus californianus]
MIVGCRMTRMACLSFASPLMSNLAKLLIVATARKSLRQLHPYVCINCVRKYSDTVGNKQNIVSESEAETFSWEALVDYSKLTAQDVKIHRKHVEAVRNKQMSYTDPGTGYMVMTRLSHLTRGECCGNACRHCPYGQKNVPDEMKRKFNSAFYS